MGAGEFAKLPEPYYGYQSADFVGGHITYAFGEYLNWLRENHPESLPLQKKAQAYHSCGVAFRLNIPEEHHYNHWIADRSIAFLQQHERDKPFFHFCSFPDPHFPFSACRPYSEIYDPNKLHLQLCPV